MVTASSKAALPKLFYAHKYTENLDKCIPIQ